MRIHKNIFYPYRYINKIQSMLDLQFLSKTDGTSPKVSHKWLMDKSLEQFLVELSFFFFSVS